MARKVLLVINRLRTALPPSVLMGGNFTIRAAGALSLAALVALSCLLGCSGEKSAPPLGAGELNRRILGLENGLSLTSVKQLLGQPESEFVESNGDGTLNYLGWRLEFRTDRLSRRIHEVFRRGAGRLQRGYPSSAQVLDLRRGMLLSALVTRLGGPDVVEVEYGANDRVERVLHYGPWELRFREGRLRLRTHW